MTCITNIKRHLRFAFVFVRHAYYLISIYKYAVLILLIFRVEGIEEGQLLERNAYFENITF